MSGCQHAGEVFAFCGQCGEDLAGAPEDVPGSLAEEFARRRQFPDFSALIRRPEKPRPPKPEYRQPPVTVVFGRPYCARCGAELAVYDPLPDVCPKCRTDLRSSTGVGDNATINTTPLTEVP